MRLVAIVFACLCSLLAANAALAWGAKGHAYVGAIADTLLTGTTAEAQAQQILGYDLKTAATWADCIRSVKKNADGSFVFTPDPHHPEYTASCTAFETPDETARMEDYAKRNWDNCNYLPGHGCHETYHFADVDKLRSRYDRSYTGTSDHDIVSAIDAAVLVNKK